LFATTIPKSMLQKKEFFKVGKTLDKQADRSIEC